MQTRRHVLYYIDHSCDPTRHPHARSMPRTTPHAAAPRHAPFSPVSATSTGARARRSLERRRPVVKSSSGLALCVDTPLALCPRPSVSMSLCVHARRVGRAVVGAPSWAHPSVSMSLSAAALSAAALSAAAFSFCAKRRLATPNVRRCRTAIPNAQDGVTSQRWRRRDG